ncbi:hypothetical protein PROFUN_08073 [Planoprotostelium fungivorum]|uniref:Apple domain-containing protein n=1 Tax=Planoprotostelium fungivorum TaxID=1890364 RepID=A0A2P6NKK7_9EUKA|nr:hypothetical protein PROFUN_08073 [Planoprotostelium fungivorum]
MKKSLALLVLFIAASIADDPIVSGFRPPAVPLVVFDPYMNIWSFSNNLYDSWPTLWDGQTKGFSGALRVDGQTYRFMGISPDFPQTAEQVSVKVWPTTTEYVFNAGPVELDLQFTTPTIPTDMDILSQPITYITYSVSSRDGKSHSVDLYYDHSGEVVTEKTTTQIVWDRLDVAGMTVLKMGTWDQVYFQPRGDGVSINWGYSYVAVEKESGARAVIATDTTCRQSFRDKGVIPTTMDMRMPRIVNDSWPVNAVSWSFTVSDSNPVTKTLIFAYDDIVSMMWFGTPLEAYWKQKYTNIKSLLSNAKEQSQNYLTLSKKLDKRVVTQTYAAGGSYYSTIASLVWRQTFGAHKLVWNADKNAVWYFLKEISSNGDFSTVDVLFPAIPLVLWANPALAELILLPHLSYANDEVDIKYDLRWAPHQLGVYPIADAKPTEQEQMPVEETGNLLLIAEYLAVLNATQYTSQIYPAYKDVFDLWATYLTSGYGSPQNEGDIDYNIDRRGNDLPNQPIQASSPEDCRAKCVSDKDCSAWGYDTCGKSNCWLKGTDTATVVNNCRASGYIKGKLVLPDPGDQLCTDDFLGPIPHNVNLAAKGIIAVDGYGDFLRAVGRGSETEHYKTVAADFAKYWVQNGKEDDHYKLQYDLSDSYSLQYNLVFQKFLKINTFDDAVLNGESQYYASQRWNKYGSPLNSNAAKDGRAFTKLDWLAWSGTLTNDATLAGKYWEAIYNYAHDTKSRVPLSDWYNTKNADQVGFQARPVVGGFYAWMLIQDNGNNRLDF